MSVLLSIQELYFQHSIFKELVEVISTIKYFLHHWLHFTLKPHSVFTKYFWYCLKMYCHWSFFSTFAGLAPNHSSARGRSQGQTTWMFCSHQHLECCHWSCMSDWKSLSVMVTELKEDHQHRTPVKGEKSKTSPPLVKAHQRTVIHTHTLILTSYIFWTSFYLRFSTNSFHVLVLDTYKHPQETRISYKKDGWDFHVYNLQGYLCKSTKKKKKKKKIQNMVSIPLYCTTLLLNVLLLATF